MSEERRVIVMMRRNQFEAGLTFSTIAYFAGVTFNTYKSQSIVIVNDSVTHLGKSAVPANERSLPQ